MSKISVVQIVVQKHEGFSSLSLAKCPGLAPPDDFAHKNEVNRFGYTTRNRLDFDLAHKNEVNRFGCTTRANKTSGFLDYVSCRH